MCKLCELQIVGVPVVDVACDLSMDTRVFVAVLSVNSRNCPVRIQYVLHGVVLLTLTAGGYCSDLWRLSQPQARNMKHVLAHECRNGV